MTIWCAPLVRPQTLFDPVVVAGVHWNRGRKRWVVEVYHNKQRIKVGGYEKEEENAAAKAYRDAATALGKASRKQTPSRSRGQGACAGAICPLLTLQPPLAHSVSLCPVARPLTAPWAPARVWCVTCNGRRDRLPRKDYRILSV
jgi:hypothetical protein